MGAEYSREKGGRQEVSMTCGTFRGHGQTVAASGTGRSLRALTSALREVLFVMGAPPLGLTISLAAPKRLTQRLCPQ
ncbi:MAG TPA: hypothetical protein PK156_50940, partial [Polyangium sp.]|nr:hypothetical protein [Polyangium sp.]